MSLKLKFEFLCEALFDDSETINNFINRALILDKSGRLFKFFPESLYKLII